MVLIDNLLKQNYCVLFVILKQYFHFDGYFKAYKVYNINYPTEIQTLQC